MNAQHQSFGATLYHLRESKSMSLRKLARAATISPTYLSQLELDQHVPSERVVLALARALDCSSDDLLFTTAYVSPQLLDIIRKRPEEIGRLLRAVATLSSREIAALVDYAQSWNALRPPSPDVHEMR